MRFCTPVDIYEDTDVGHGRVETRICKVFTDLTHIENVDKWGKLNCIVAIESTRYIKSTAQEQKETRLYITSLEPSAKKIGESVRAHWGIENSLHWVLDVTYGEDKSRVRDRNSAANLTALRKLSASLLARTPGHRSKSIAQRRKLAGWVPDYAFDVLASISEK